MPSPTLPTNPSAIPSPTASGIPRPSIVPAATPGDSSQQRSGPSLPSLPGLPQRPRGDSQNDGDTSSGSTGQSDGSDDGELGQLPSTGPLRTADQGESDNDDNANGEGGLVQQRSGDEEQSNSSEGAEDGTELGGLPSSGAGEAKQGGQEQVVAGDPGAGILGTPSDSQNTDWVISNELPENEKVRGGMPDLPTVDEEDAGSKSEAAEELKQTLAGIDGSIMSDREDQAEKLNERAGGVALPGDLVAVGDSERQSGETGGANAPPAAGGTSREEIPHVNHPERRSTPNEKPTVTTGSDIPDARDDDIVARQLREAALAEKDPQVREGLWEELRRYKERTK